MTQNHDDFAERLRRAKAARAALNAAQNAMDAADRRRAVTMFDPVCTLFGDMYSAGVCFPAGLTPSAQSVRETTRTRLTLPKLTVAIDTRRQLVVEVVKRGDRLVYHAYIWEMHSRLDPLWTADVQELSDWLLAQVAQFDINQTREPPPAPPPRRRSYEQGPKSLDSQLFNPLADEDQDTSLERRREVRDDDTDDGRDGREQRVIELD